MKLLLLALLFSLPGFAGTTTLLTCGKDDKDRLYMELRETDTEYEFEFRETYGVQHPNNSVVHSLLHARSTKGRYHVVFKSPKIVDFGAHKVRICRSLGTDLLYCSSTYGRSTATLTNVGTGEVQQAHFSSFEVHTNIQTEEWVSGWEEAQTRKWITLQSTTLHSSPRHFDVECRLAARGADSAVSER